MTGPKYADSDSRSFAGLEAYVHISAANFLKPFTYPTMRHFFAASFRPQKNPNLRHARRFDSFAASLAITLLLSSFLQQ